MKESKPAGVAQAAKIKAGMAIAPHPMRNVGGRPTVRVRVTPAMLADIEGHVAAGLSMESALVLVGVSRDAIDRWKKLNPAVRQKLDRAEVKWEREIVGNITEKAKTDWKAGFALLERRLPARWAPVGKTEVSGPGGGPLQVLTIHKQLLERVARAGDKAVINVTPRPERD